MKTYNKKALGSNKPLTPQHNNKLAALFSSESDEWPTPPWILDILKTVYRFSLDPCSTDINNICGKHYTLDDDGLKKSWAAEVIWMNPPYSQIEEWMGKAYESAKEEGATVVCLVPARTDTKWWHNYVMRGNCQIVFVQGRLKFGHAKNSAPFPSIIVVMRPPQATHFPEGYLGKLINEGRPSKRKRGVVSSLKP